MDSLLDLIVVPFDEKYIPELVVLLAEAYVVSPTFYSNNPVVLMENKTQSQLEQSFAKKLRIYADKKLFQQGITHIVGCWCFGNLLDYFPKGDINYSNTNFKVVPTESDLSQYMEWLAIQPIYERFKAEKYVLYGFNYCIRKSYQGKGYPAQVYYLTALHHQSLNIDFGFGYTVNPLVDKGNKMLGVAYIENIETDLDDLVIVESKRRPFKGKNVKTILFSLQNEKSIRKLEKYFLGKQSKL